MRFSTAFFLASLAALAIAVPTPTRTLNSRSVTECGQYDSVQTGNYIVYSDLWGEDNASSGSQCFTVDGLSGNTIEWSTRLLMPRLVSPPLTDPSLAGLGKETQTT